MSNENSSSPDRQYSKSPPPTLDRDRQWHHGPVEKHSDEIYGSENDYDYRAGPEMTAATAVGKEGDNHYDDDLQRYNDFRHENDHANDDLPERQHRWDMQRISQAITSQLPISERQRGKVVEAIRRLDFSKFGPQKGIVRVTLGVASVIVMDERQEMAKTDDGTIELPDDSEDFWLRQTDEFKQIREAHDISMGDINTIKRITREQFNGRVPEAPDVGPHRDPHLPKMTMADRPDEYWERVPPNYWHSVARRWELHSEQYEKALPDKYLELIDRLRHWEPWNMDYPSSRNREGGTAESTEEIESPQRNESIEEELDDLVEAVEGELSEETEAEAEALLEEIAAEDAS